MLKHKIQNKETGILLYGITPPKLNNSDEKLKGIAQRQMNRLEGKKLDGLIVYDIQDESSRTSEPRPFPFMKTYPTQEYVDTYLHELDLPKVVYRSVGNYAKETFQKWVETLHNKDSFSVFVGAPSKDQQVNITLHEAYHEMMKAGENAMLGGVTIPERHESKGDEHVRIMQKEAHGCQFFVSQCVYSTNHAKNFLSDYYYYCKEQDRPMSPIIFTLTPCGSEKTLDFMHWLGIDIPRWMALELKHSKDILEQSLEMCKNTANELYAYATEKGIPIGFNVESVAIRKAEIDASITLLDYLANLLKK